MLGDYTEGVFTFDIIATQQRTTAESIQIARVVKQVNLSSVSKLKFLSVRDENDIEGCH